MANCYGTLPSGDYTVVYDANGGSGTAMTSSTHTCGASKNLTANSYTRTGYTFSMWNTNSSGTGTSYSSTQSFTPSGTNAGGTVTLYAIWTAKSGYAVNYSTNGGTPTSISAAWLARASR
ncbi:MAG: InlB B-repeat-containing protein [Prevotellaceae bacterium]|nr:InlB B-repeat-containing protein [Prevotellaceae bacterium]